MTGLRLMNELSDPGAPRQRARSNIRFRRRTVPKKPQPARSRLPAKSARRSVRTDLPIPAVAYLDRKARVVPDLNEVWSYMNPYMLFGRHLGFRGNFEKALGERDARALELFNEHGRNQAEAEKVHEDRRGVAILRSGAPWKLDRAVRARRRRARAHVSFPAAARGRETLPERLYSSGRDGQRDHLALFVVTAGAGIREKSEEAKAAGQYFFSHGLQALALETAEACAEWLHRRIREDWGFPDPPTMTMAGAFHLPLSRQTLQLWLSGLPEPRGPGRDLDAAATGGYRRPPHRRNDDGPRG